MSTSRGTSRTSGTTMSGARSIASMIAAGCVMDSCAEICVLMRRRGNGSWILPWVVASRFAHGSVDSRA
ncbi:MAG TPA: hypothetical protein VF461_00650 [Gemmatimonadaceae bacterium]